MSKTNVPENIRTMWTDLYKLFDKYYMIENTPEAWKTFWMSAQELSNKHHNNRFTEGCCIVADIISDRMKAEIRNDDIPVGTPEQIDMEGVRIV